MSKIHLFYLNFIFVTRPCEYSHFWCPSSKFSILARTNDKNTSLLSSQSASWPASQPGRPASGQLAVSRRPASLSQPQPASASFCQPASQRPLQKGYDVFHKVITNLSLLGQIQPGPILTPSGPLRSASQPASQPGSQSANQPIGQPANRPTNQLANYRTSKSLSQTANKPFHIQLQFKKNLFGVLR